MSLVLGDLNPRGSIIQSSIYFLVRSCSFGDYKICRNLHKLAIASSTSSCILAPVGKTSALPWWSPFQGSVLPVCRLQMVVDMSQEADSVADMQVVYTLDCSSIISHLLLRQSHPQLPYHKESFLPLHHLSEHQSKAIQPPLDLFSASL